MADKITISLPKELRKKLEEKIKETNFKSIQEYILYFLEQIVTETKADEVYTKEEDAAFHANPVYNKEDEVALKKKLAEMGYL